MEPNSIVAFFLIPPCVGEANVEIVDDGLGLLASFELPQVKEEHFNQRNNEISFSDQLVRLAEIAAFTKYSAEIQKLLLPFTISNEKEVMVESLNGHDYLKVIVKKKVDVKEVSVVKVEKRYLPSELTINAGKIVIV
jgi:hypothetical protein